jgi:hypothetical protein
MKKSIVIAGVCLMALTFGATAAMASGGFKGADENVDGKVSWEEAYGHNTTLTRALFDAADTDHNGSLDETEYGLLFGLSCGTN